jgi:uncharacterized protein
MDVVRFDDVTEFLEAVRPLLLADVARNNLALGIVGTLVDHPHVYPRFHLWSAERDGVVVGAALMTEPYNLVLAEPADGAAVDGLADAVLASGARVPGVVGNEPWVDRFTDRWSATTGAHATLAMAQGVHALASVRSVRRAPGAERPATENDRPLLATWLRAFAEEAMPEPDPDPSRLERVLDLRLKGSNDTGLWLWEVDGIPVSLAGYSELFGGGARVGPVYTPPAHRRRGFATSLVAAVSRWLLAAGHAGCFLYTDLANPTSNRIYAEIGYVPVCRSKELSFEPVSSPTKPARRPRGRAREP